MIGNSVRPVCIGDVNLDHHQFWQVTKRERLHMLVHNGGAIIGREVGGQRGQAEGRKQRILDGTPGRVACLFQGGQNEFDVQRSRTGSDHRPPAVASAGAVSGMPPKRRCLPRNSSNAASRSLASKSGHMRSVNQSSAYAHSHNKKSDKRFSPPVSPVPSAGKRVAARKYFVPQLLGA